MSYVFQFDSRENAVSAELHLSAFDRQIDAGTSLLPETAC